MALTCCLWHAFDIWQIAHTEDEGAFRMKWLNYVQSGGNWKTGKTVKLKVRFPGRMEICAATRASTFNCHNWQARGRGFAFGIGNIGGTTTPKILGLYLARLPISYLQTAEWHLRPLAYGNPFLEQFDWQTAATTKGCHIIILVLRIVIVLIIPPSGCVWVAYLLINSDKRVKVTVNARNKDLLAPSSNPQWFRAYYLK